MERVMLYIKFVNNLSKYINYLEKKWTPTVKLSLPPRPLIRCSGILDDILNLFEKFIPK